LQVGQEDLPLYGNGILGELPFLIKRNERGLLLGIAVHDRDILSYMGDDTLCMWVVIEFCPKTIEDIEHKVRTELLTEVAYGKQCNFPILPIHTPHVVEQIQPSGGRNEDHH